MKKILAILTLSISQIAFANTTTYDVEGMHCGSCAKAIKAQVCKLDGLETCDVTLGKIMISPKSGVTITEEQIQAAMSKAGEYKIIHPTKSK